jgi:threonyl-tRNA synthetase
MVVEVEKKEIEHRRRTGQKMTQLEIDALIAEIKKTLSAEEGAAYEALNTVIED